MLKELHTILLVEDDKFMRQIVRNMLEKNNFIVLEAALGKRSIDILKQHDVDLIIIDLGLPDGCRLHYIRTIKQMTKAPVMVLSAAKSDSTKVESFDIGADDFVSKPFCPDVMLARIKAHIRRYHDDSSSYAVNENDPTQTVTIHEWILDRTKFQLFDKFNQSANLTIQEYKVIDFLASHAGRVIPREELCEAIREENYIPTTRALDVKITRIRKKMSDHIDPQIIQTVRGVGYILNEQALNNSVRH